MTDQQRIAELETICAEAYQVVGYLAYEAGLFNDPKTAKILDNLSQHKLVHDDVLPYPTK